MGTVRECCKADLGNVAQLWAQEFHKRPSVEDSDLRRYFEEMFFSSPWQNARVPSLIYEDRGGNVVGFLGVIPRQMKFRGTSIQIAVASQLMLDSKKPRGFAALELLRKFFSGAQDLSFSDGTNELARKVWIAAGGEVAMLYSSVWTRVLRPAQYLAGWCENRNQFTYVAKGSRPLGWVLDTMAIRMTQSPYSLPEPEGTEEDPSEEDLLRCIRQFTGKRELQPLYEPDSFHWLLQRAAEQTTHGTFLKRIVRDTKREIIGWYLYYAKPGGIAQVVQLGGRANAIDQVLNQLFYQAWRRGAVAVSGETDPKFALELSRNRCRFSWPGGVVVQSRSAEILNSIYKGDAYLTRLDGEWWMRFCDLSGVEGARKYPSPWTAA